LKEGGNELVLPQKLAALSSFSQNPRNMLTVTLILFPLFVIENLEMYLAGSLVDFSTSAGGLALYAAIFAGYLALQFFAINFIKQNSRLLRSKSRIVEGIQTVVILAQYVLAINIGLILTQMFLFSQYTVMSLVFPSVIGIGLACALFFVFGFQFLSWRRNLRQTLGIVLFAFSFLILAFAQIIAVSFLTTVVLQLDQIITPNSEVDPPAGLEDELLIILLDNYVYLDYAAFALMIVATALLLWQYARKISKVTLAVLIALPLVGYATTNIEAYHIPGIESFTHTDNFWIFVSLTSVFGWLSHSFAFFYVARKLPDSSIKIFLSMTAIGFIFFSISNTVDIRTGSYPPYAANSFALLPISVFLILFGIYSSALSLSQDVSLRKHVKSLARSDKNLLSSIGTGQLQNEIARVVGTLKGVIESEEAELKTKSGIDSSMQQEEIEDYLQQVVKELQTKKKQSQI
jgi:hypothetical protein